MTVIAVEGSAPLNDRWVLTLAPTGGDITIDFVSDTEPPIRLTGVGAATEVVVDGHDRTVTVDSVPAFVEPGSGWPALVPGSNTIDVTGATGTLTYTPLNL